MFARGQEIVCINADGWTDARGRRAKDQSKMPQKGQHYTCGGYGEEGFIYLVEFWGPMMFEATGFRPVIKRKTDISVFEQIRRKQEQVVKSPAKVLDPLDEDFVER